MKFETLFNTQQKKSIFILQIGTFLEYFDLMLYVHMAVILNELFFPPTELKMSAFLAAFAFCSTYVLRPFGALIFGYIGDNYGRKPTIIITTTIMAFCCLIMTCLPIYAEIGITASIVVSILRVIQGMTSMGEAMGASIFITEITKPPKQYPAVASIGVATVLGTMTALAIATLTARTGFNWRWAFGFGIIIALVSTIARTKLEETPEFIDKKLKIKKMSKSSDNQKLNGNVNFSCSIVEQEKFDFKSFFHFISTHCGWPLCFYLIYIYFIPALKNSCNYSSEDVILHNFLLTIINTFRVILWTWLSFKIYPLFISKFIGFNFIFIITLIPFMLSGGINNYLIFFVQVLLIFGLNCSPSDSIFISHFPVSKRFTAVSFGYALSTSLTYIFISFGLVYLTEWFGYYGIWVISFPIAYIWLKAIYYYESLEKKAGKYPPKSEWQIKS